MDFIPYLLTGNFLEDNKYSSLKERASIVFKSEKQKAFFIHLERFPKGLFCCICTLQNRHRHV